MSYASAYGQLLHEPGLVTSAYQVVDGHHCNQEFSGTDGIPDTQAVESRL